MLYFALTGQKGKRMITCIFGRNAMEYHSYTHVGTAKGTELCGEDFTVSIKFKHVLTTQHRNSSLGINL